MSEEEVEEEKEDPDAKGSTREYPMFDPNKNLDGGLRSSRTAHQMAVDASKFLKFLKFAQGPISTQPDWDRLLDRDLLKAFTNKVAESVGPPGVLRKLEALEAALHFYRVDVLGLGRSPDNTEKFTKAQQISETLQSWRATYRRSKRRLQRKSMEKLSRETLTLDEVDEVLESKRMWQEFLAVADELDRGQQVFTKRMQKPRSCSHPS